MVWVKVLRQVVFEAFHVTDIELFYVWGVIVLGPCYFLVDFTLQRDNATVLVVLENWIVDARLGLKQV